MSSHPEPDNHTPGDGPPEPGLQEQQLELGEDDSAIALRKAWERTLRTLAGQSNKPTFDNWLRPLKPLSWDGRVVVLGAPSSFARNWVEKKYAQPLRDGLAQHLGQPDVQVRFVISTPDVQPLLGEKPLPLQQAASAPPPTASPAALPVPAGEGPPRHSPVDPRNPFALELAAAPLNEGYTFDEFVVGKSNRLAHAGAMAVAQSPGASYNPLFLYGTPGLGKCVAASEFLHLADGRRVQAGGLIGQQFCLLTLAQEGLCAVPARAAFNAVEPVWAIQTESGRCVTRNAQHPLWVGQGVARGGKNHHRIDVKGWTALEDIRPGDLVAVPERLPAFGDPVPVPEYEIKLLAYLLGDGEDSQKSVRFSQQDNAQLAEFKECVALTSCRLIQHNKYDRRVVGPRGRVERGAETCNDVINLLRRHDMMERQSRDKRIPASVFRLSEEQLRLFLSRLFATDGWASCSPRRSGNRAPGIEIGFRSTSEDLIRDIQELLLKLGILGRISPKPKVRSWTLAIHAASEIIKFCDNIGIFGKEEAVERVRRFAAAARARRPNRGAWRHREAPPGMRWERVASIEAAGTEATVAIEVPGHETFLTTFWEHNTHLMHAIGHEVRLRMPQARIAYVSGETFTNHFVTALRDRRTEDFRRAYRSVDIWLVDDIQSIAMGQKEQTKEEFFHTFNTLHQMRRQIVIASDRSPSELRAMDERLRSRFMGGLVADIAPPELEMRMAILQKKAILGNMGISEDVIAFMANLIQSNIRALEGALIKLMAFASLTKTPVTRQLASDVLSTYYVDPGPSRALLSAHPEDHAHAPPPLPMDTGVEAIADAVAAQMGVTRAQILAGGARSGRGGDRLQGDPGYARQVAMYLAKEVSGVPLINLATAFGCKNHTSIAQAHKRLRDELPTDKDLAVLVERIRKAICNPK